MAVICGIRRAPARPTRLRPEGIHERERGSGEAFQRLFQRRMGVLDGRQHPLPHLSEMCQRSQQKKPHSTGFSGKGYHRSAKASRGEDLQIEEPV